MRKHHLYGINQVVIWFLRQDGLRTQRKMSEGWASYTWHYNVELLQCSVMWEYYNRDDLCYVDENWCHESWYHEWLTSSTNPIGKLFHMWSWVWTIECGESSIDNKSPVWLKGSRTWLLAPYLNVHGVSGVHIKPIGSWCVTSWSNQLWWI